MRLILSWRALCCVLTSSLLGITSIIYSVKVSSQFCLLVCFSRVACRPLLTLVHLVQVGLLPGNNTTCKHKQMRQCVSFVSWFIHVLFLASAAAVVSVDSLRQPLTTPHHSLLRSDFAFQGYLPVFINNTLDPD